MVTFKLNNKLTNIQLNEKTLLIVRVYPTWATFNFNKLGHFIPRLKKNCYNQKISDF